MQNQSFKVEIPPFDPLLLRTQRAMPARPPVTDETIDLMRDTMAEGPVAISADLEKFAVETSEHVADGPRGDIQITRIAPAAYDGPPLPAIYFIHGGGMILGDRFRSLSPLHLVEWVEKHQLIVLTVEHRMPPKFSGLAPVEDCQAGLAWVADNAEALVVDRERIILAGISGGGGLAAGTALLNRDRNGPKLLAQLLWCPQVDDRTHLPSSSQFTRDVPGVLWSREDNAYAWNLILGDGHEDTEASIYAAANRADDLRGLPQTFIEVGTNEVFRDYAVEYASKLWKSGVSAELHVWPGAMHAFNLMDQHVPVAAEAVVASENWVQRVLAASGSDR